MNLFSSTTNMGLIVARMLTSVVLSPHMDDAVFSIGGTIGNLIIRKERVVVYNVFSVTSYVQNPKLRIAPFATTMRYGEEIVASILMRYNRRFFPFEDNYMRKNANPAIVTSRVEKSIQKNLNLDNPVRVFAPLGVGNHTDHKLLSETAMKLVENRTIRWDQLLLYEDLPYSAKPNAVEKGIQSFQNKFGVKLQPSLVDVSAQFTLKMVVSGVYRSQYDTQDLRDLKNYARSLSQGANQTSEDRFFERQWTIVSQ